MLELLPGSSSGGRGEGGRVPVGGVKGVDEGVDSGAVGARGDGAGLVRGGVAAKVAAVPVEVEVPVGGVVGVDEGVVGVGRDNRPPHRLDRLSHTLDRLGRDEGLLGRRLLVESGAGLGHGAVVVFVVVVGGFPGLDKLLLLRLLLLGKLLARGRGGLELSSGLAVGSGGHVVALEDPEAVLAGGVPHGDGLAILVDVAVLANPLAISSCLLPVNCSVLLGIGGSKPEREKMR